MDIAKTATHGDRTLEISGLKFFLEPKAQDMLLNTSIDFQDGQGFVLSGMQQNSCGTCSC